MVITAARNEEQFVPETIKSMLSQTLRPLQWVIVDDGSYDSTPDILKALRETNDWVVTVSRADRGYDQRGFGIAEALHDGIAAVSADEYEYLAIVDADVRFDEQFFERLLAVFDREPDLGMAGGLGYERVDGKLVAIEQAPDTVFGATRVYRRACFEQIGGIEIAWGWDAIDETRARMIGWGVRTVGDIAFEHLKHQTLDDKFEHGTSAYVMGSSFGYVLARSIWRMGRAPYVVGGVALMAGYLQAAFRRLDRVGDEAYRRALRQDQASRFRSRLRRDATITTTTDQDAATGGKA